MFLSDPLEALHLILEFCILVSFWQHHTQGLRLLCQSASSSIDRTPDLLGIFLVLKIRPESSVGVNWQHEGSYLLNTHASEGVLKYLVVLHKFIRLCGVKVDFG